MMLFNLRFLFIITLYSFGLLLFGVYIYFHVYLQLFTCYLCKEVDEPKKIYDYIVVGSGTAGSIISLRLAQDQNNVLLLEAGSFSNFLFDIPAIGPLLQLSSLDWQYHTVPQDNACRGLENNISRWPMGKIFGGTNRLNNLLHVRGHKEDFDNWFRNKSDYNYDRDILDYYKKLESQDGPLYKSNLIYESPLAQAVLNAANILGFNINTENDGYPSGFMKPQVNLKNSKRWTTSDALLRKNIENLKIITHAQVTKILFKRNFEAYAINYTYLGETKIVKARKGIILSAGVIGTPKILLLSGIGPKKDLDKLGIKTKHNLPVGQNLQDHITTGLDLVLLNQSLSINAANLMSPHAVYDYFLYGTGPWTTVGCEAIGFCHTETNLTKPNLQFMIIPFGVTSDGGKHLKRAMAISSESWTNYFSNLIGKQVISILPIVLQPKSKGFVQLLNSNPYTPPIINPKYLSHPADIKVLTDGIKIIKKIITTAPMQALGAELNTQKFPGCEHFDFDTPFYWECYIKHLTITSYHPCCTCKFGSDETSIVDYDFKVKGTNKLFIGDASVFPDIPTGNINAVVAMIAEKVADSVKMIEYLSKGSCKKTEVLIQKIICLRL